MLFINVIKEMEVERTSDIVSSNYILHITFYKLPINVPRNY